MIVRKLITKKIVKMSNFEHTVYKALLELFPHTKIYRQHTIRYQGRVLYFDFFVKSISLYIECQGEQHYAFNRFFHNTIMNYKDSVYRDNLKEQYVLDKNATLIQLRYKEHKDITSKELIEVILNGFK